MGRRQLKNKPKNMDGENTQQAAGEGENQAGAGENTAAAGEGENQAGAGENTQGAGEQQA